GDRPRAVRVRDGRVRRVPLRRPGRAAGGQTASSTFVSQRRNATGDRKVSAISPTLSRVAPPSEAGELGGIGTPSTSVPLRLAASITFQRAMSVGSGVK